MSKFKVISHVIAAGFLMWKVGAFGCPRILPSSLTRQTRALSYFSAKSAKAAEHDPNDQLECGPVHDIASTEERKSPEQTKTNRDHRPPGSTMVPRKKASPSKSTARSRSKFSSFGSFLQAEAKETRPGGTPAQDHKEGAKEEKAEKEKLLTQNVSPSDLLQENTPDKGFPGPVHPNKESSQGAPGSNGHSSASIGRPKKDFKEKEAASDDADSTQSKPPGRPKKIDLRLPSSDARETEQPGTSYSFAYNANHGQRNAVGALPNTPPSSDGPGSSHSSLSTVFLSFDERQSELLGRLSFSNGSDNTKTAVELAELIDKSVAYSSPKDAKITAFLRCLRLVYFLYRPAIFTCTNLLNVSKIKLLVDAAPSDVKDISLLYPLERMLPTGKILKDSAVTLPSTLHQYILSVSDKAKAKMFAYEYYLEYLMKDQSLSSNIRLMILVVRSLSSYQFAARSAFEHFLRSGGIPTPEFVLELLSSGQSFDCSSQYEPLYDQFIRLPFLEQQLSPPNNVNTTSLNFSGRPPSKMISDQVLLTTSLAMIKMYARGMPSSPLFFQSKIADLRTWISSYALAVAENGVFKNACQDALQERPLLPADFVDDGLPMSDH